MLKKLTKVGVLLAVVVVLIPFGSFKKESPPPRPKPLEATEVTWPRVKVTELVLKEGMSMDDIDESVDGLEQLEHLEQ